MSLLNYLESIAEKNACGDREDFNAYDYSGGNYDDAYEVGVDDGEIFLARQLLDSFQEELNYRKEQK